MDEKLIGLQRQREAAKERLREKADIDYTEFSDPEMDALRYKYNYFLLEAEQLLPDTIKLPEDQADEQADTEREVADMKARFRRYYVREKSKQYAEEQRAEGEEHLWKKRPPLRNCKLRHKGSWSGSCNPTSPSCTAKLFPCAKENRPSPSLPRRSGPSLGAKSNSCGSRSPPD